MFISFPVIPIIGYHGEEKKLLGMFTSCDTRRVSWEKRRKKNSEHESTRKDSTMKSETQCAAHPMDIIPSL
jgi:hypothetical protein